MTTGGAGIASTTRLIARVNNRRFSPRPNRERNDGHIFGLRTVRAGPNPPTPFPDREGGVSPPSLSGKGVGGLGLALNHDRSLPHPRVSVAQSSRGRRVPMVFTQVTARRGSNFEMRC